MEARRRLRRLLFFLPVVLAGILAAAAPPSPSKLASAAPAASISAPHQSLPTPDHNEATCAFCQAVAFTPCAARAADRLPEALGAEYHEHLSSDDHLNHSESSSPPRSRAPPILPEF